MRSMSGIGSDRPDPNMSAHEICLGSWSTLVALKTFRVPIALIIARR